MSFLKIAENNFQDFITGRYVTNDHILPFLNSLPKSFHLKVEGKSVLSENIYSIKIGSGKIKILIWSQMHGNESTTTKTIIDLLAFLKNEDSEAKQILENFTLYVIPILNPDGAKAYTRVNANEVDLNRDAVDLSQPESIVLRNCFDNFKPDFAFNMHDQRTLFAAGNENNAATISFLSPAFNIETDLNQIRIKAMQVISAVNNEVKKYIPNQIGRFDDAFNLNCIGDCFTNLGVSTILFEAGHFSNDYKRDETRKIVFVSLLKALDSIASEDYLKEDIQNYFEIPENKKLINDILVKNIKIQNEENSKRINLGIQYKEVLKSNEIYFIPIVDTELVKNHQFGHLEIDCSDFELTTEYEICDLLNKLGLYKTNNGIYVVN